MTFQTIFHGIPFLSIEHEQWAQKVFMKDENLIISNFVECIQKFSR